MTWFKKEDRPLSAPREEDKTVRTEGLFTKCESCRAIIWKKDIEATEMVCPKCNHHFRIGARRRLGLLFDDARYEVFDTEIVSPDRNTRAASPASLKSSTLRTTALRSPCR